MLEKLQNTIVRKKAESMLNQHGLQVKHFLPGRLRLAMVDWRSREEEVLSLLEEMKNDPDITSVEFTKETGTVLIYYNKDAVNQSITLNRWKSIIEKYI